MTAAHRVGLSRSPTLRAAARACTQSRTTGRAGPRGFLAVLAMLTMGGCTPTTLMTAAPLTVAGHAIAPYEFHDECGEIATGERLDFQFSATRPVHFEIYYSDSGMRIAPVVRDEVTEGSGVFPPPVTRRYCVRWDAGREGAIIDYRIRVLPPQRP